MSGHHSDKDKEIARDNHILASKAFLLCEIFTKFSLTRLCKKPFLIWLLTITPHLTYLATLPWNLSLTACFLTMMFYTVVWQHMQGVVGLLITTHTHTYTRFTALHPGLPEWAGTRKVKPIWILLKQETVSGSGISWVICKSAPHSREITMPVPHHSVFYRPDALTAAQSTASKHWRQLKIQGLKCMTRAQVLPPLHMLDSWTKTFAQMSW